MLPGPKVFSGKSAIIIVMFCILLTSEMNEFLLPLQNRVCLSIIILEREDSIFVKRRSSLHLNVCLRNVYVKNCCIFTDVRIGSI